MKSRKKIAGIFLIAVFVMAAFLYSPSVEAKQKIKISQKNIVLAQGNSQSLKLTGVSSRNQAL